MMIASERTRGTSAELSVVLGKSKGTKGKKAG